MIYVQQERSLKFRYRIFQNLRNFGRYQIELSTVFKKERPFFPPKRMISAGEIQQNVGYVGSDILDLIFMYTNYIRNVVQNN